MPRSPAFACRPCCETPTGGINLYAYVGNSPVSFRDPFGLLADDLAEGAAATGGADSTDVEQAPQGAARALVRRLLTRTVPQAVGAAAVRRALGATGSLLRPTPAGGGGEARFEACRDQQIRTGGAGSCDPYPSQPIVHPGPQLGPAAADVTAVAIPGHPVLGGTCDSSPRPVSCDPTLAERLTVLLKAPLR